MSWWTIIMTASTYSWVARKMLIIYLLIYLPRPQRQLYRPLRQLITSCYLSVICRKTGARRRCSGGQDSVLSTFASFRDDFETQTSTFFSLYNDSSEQHCINFYDSWPPRPASHQLAAEVVYSLAFYLCCVTERKGSELPRKRAIARNWEFNAARYFSPHYMLRN